MARPITTSYSDEERAGIIEHVLAELSGGRAVSRILREDEGMPASSQFWKWHFESKELQEKVARARENGVEAKLDECEEIADSALDRDSAAAAKVRVDTRFKYAQMIQPRKYGSKLDVTSGGEKLDLAGAVAAARARAAGEAE